MEDQSGGPHLFANYGSAPTFYNGKLYVPVSSIEEGLRHRASTLSVLHVPRQFGGTLDPETGAQKWKSYTVLDPAKPFKTNKAGVQQLGPAGAALWSSPTIDAKRKLVYVATGDSYTDEEINTSDAIIAYSLDTGKIAWISQVEAKDNFVMGRGANLPDAPGPDYDFGSSVILRDIGGGKQILLAGQKSGILWGLDPDNKGKILWQIKLGAGSALGGIEWGHSQPITNILTSRCRIALFATRRGARAFRLWISPPARMVWATRRRPPSPALFHRGAFPPRPRRFR